MVDALGPDERLGVVAVVIAYAVVGDEDLMSVSGPREPGKESRARALAWTRQGRSPWNQPVGICGIGLSSLPPMTRGRPEGVTRLAMCNDRGSRRMVWRGASGPTLTP